MGGTRESDAWIAWRLYNGLSALLRLGEALAVRAVETSARFFAEIGDRENPQSLQRIEMLQGESWETAPRGFRFSPKRILAIYARLAIHGENPCKRHGQAPSEVVFPPQFRVEWARVSAGLQQRAASSAAQEAVFATAMCNGGPMSERGWALSLPPPRSVTLCSLETRRSKLGHGPALETV